MNYAALLGLTWTCTVAERKKVFKVAEHVFKFSFLSYQESALGHSCSVLLTAFVGRKRLKRWCGATWLNQLLCSTINSSKGAKGSWKHRVQWLVAYCTFPTPPLVKPWTFFFFFNCEVSLIQERFLTLYSVCKPWVASSGVCTCVFMQKPRLNSLEHRRSMWFPNEWEH